MFCAMLVTTTQCKAAGALGRAHTVAAVDQTKLQTAAELQEPMQADPTESSAWQKRRPGATFFERLQVG